MSEHVANEQQVEYWNDEAGAKWVEMQEKLDLQIGPLGLSMLDTAAISEGEHVLDVGCGCGATTLEIAQRVSNSGHVTGLDISAPMLGRARERAEEQGLGNIEFTQADAQVASLTKSTYDLLTSRFGVMFFENPIAAFANLKSALKPDGRLCFTCWRPMPENPWIAVPLVAAAPLVDMPAPPGPEEPGPFSLADADRIRLILTEAGFADITIESRDTQLRVGAGDTAEDAADFVFKVGPLSRILAEATDQQRDDVHNAVIEAMQHFYSDEGVIMTFATWVVTARNG